MKKVKIITSSLLYLMSILFLMTAQNAAGQQTGKSSQAIPADINKIFTHSCTPCHTSKGSGFGKSMVNFDEWSKLSPEKQGTKAEKINKAITSGFMPKKSAVQKKPDIVLTKEQKEMIQKWADSLKPPKK